MEFKNLVFNSARDGKLFRIKMFLSGKPKNEVQTLVSAYTNGATPLLMATRNGHLDVVEFLLDHCYADIEQVGCVIFDGETIDGAPPLWCAAAAGHLDVLKFLISRGARVNSTTSTNSTPLRAACFDGHLDIVQYLVEHHADTEIANRHGHTCLMIACYKGHTAIAKYLLDHGSDVNKKSAKGNTALHDCAESGSLDIMKILLKRGAKMDVDSYGMTPMMAAAITGHAHIVEFLLRLPETSRYESIDALELLGATYVDKKHDMMGALRYWKRAMEERFKRGQMPIKKSGVPSLLSVYESAMEFQNLSQLEELISDPDEMRMQALLVRERILGPAHPDTSYYIRYRGAVYADTGNYERCIRLWMCALEVQQKVLEPLSPMTSSSLLSFAELFSFMMSEPSERNRKIPHVSFNNVFLVFQKALFELERAHKVVTRLHAPEKDFSPFHRTLVIIVHLIGLMCRLKAHITPEEEFNFKQAVYRLVGLRLPGRNGWSALHVACFRDALGVGRYPLSSFPSVEVVELLLEVGADPNGCDESNNTPLHIAAFQAHKSSGHAVISTLLKHGAHLDFRNMENRTPLDMVVPPLDISPIPYLTLQCLAANVIRRYGIHYKGLIPASLETFVSRH